MGAIDAIREERLKKIAVLTEAGMDPYPADSRRTHDIKTVRGSFDDLLAAATPLTVAGRVMSERGQGGIIFIDLDDGSGRIQALLKKDEMDASAFDLFQATVDSSDFIEVSGVAFVTKRGEQSVFVSGWRMLAKSLRPVPDQWFGLKDEDERYRKRYLDIILDAAVKERFVRRSRFWNVMRSYLLDRGFIEVETPVLETTTGGAEAAPFATHHNALDIDVYLRISAGELWQKRLMVAGLPKVFEIGRIFRNEGMSAEHLQDYTQLEFYEAYQDYRHGMEMIQDLYRTIARELYGTLEFDIRGHHVDLGSKWQRFDFSKLIEERFSLDPVTEKYGKTGKRATEKDLKEICTQAGIEYEKGAGNFTRTVDNLWKLIRKDIAGPGFLVGVPDSLEPLAKHAPDGRTVERFQVLIAGSEVGKGFSELNDPVDQAERFKYQQALRDAGDEEAQMADSDYVEALEYGMPPAFGFGVSERLFSFLEGVPVREAQIFPLMKPRS